MKNLNILILLIITSLSCKSQTILPLETTPTDIKNLPKPIYRKDINNIRDNFYGVWQGTISSSELTLYFYKIDDMPIGLFGALGESFVDAIFGYYVYKENGVEIINSRIQAQINNTSETVKRAPFSGTTSNGQDINSMFFIDYGISIPLPNGSSSNGKGCLVDLTIIDNDNIQIQANFELRNIGEVLAPYNYDFSIPQNMVLTKIASVPPPLN